MISRITKDTTISCIDIEFSSKVLLSFLDFRENQYTLTRMFELKDKNVLKKLNINVEKVNKMFCIEKSNNKS